MKSNALEKLLWSIALPGFGQLLNGKFLKGLLFISLEFLINSCSNLNLIIMSSFQGNIDEAIAQTNYQWLMFYPCVYMFAIWDAYKDAGGGTSPYAVVPVVSGAYFGTVGIIFSDQLFGAVWLGLLGMFIGIGAGMLAKSILTRRAAAASEHGSDPVYRHKLK